MEPLSTLDVWDSSFSGAPWAPLPLLSTPPSAQAFPTSQEEDVYSQRQASTEIDNLFVA